MEKMFETSVVCGDVEYELKQMETFVENSSDVPEITYGFGEFLTILCCG